MNKISTNMHIYNVHIILQSHITVTSSFTSYGKIKMLIYIDSNNKYPT